MEVGQIFDNRYQVDALLHRGTKSVVAAASHLLVEQRCAIKMLRPELASNPERVARLRQSARLGAAIAHPNIASISDFGTVDHAPYMVLELIDGETIAQQLMRQHFDPARAVELGVQLCQGLAAIHDKGIAHRNIEPANLMIVRGSLLKILDFFYARPIGAPSFAGTGRGMIGAPPFAAPEQLRDASSADARSDVWSAGAVLAMMMSGEPPFAAPSFAALVAKLVDGAHPKLAPTIPGPLAAVIVRCLSHDPSARYASAAELAVALRQSL